MTKVKCEGCGVELHLSEQEFEAEKKEVAGMIGDAAVSAICPPCGELVQITYAMAYAHGINLDGETVLKAIQTAHELRRSAAVDPDMPARERLIRTLWAHHKAKGVDLTADPVAVDYDPFSEDSITFERKVYDGKTVIEAEGLVVERL